MYYKKRFLVSTFLFVLFSFSLIIPVEAQASWIMWSQTYGGTENNYANCVIQTSDGGFVLAGKWLVKTDELGNLEWNRTYDGADRFSSVVEASDGGLVLAGDTRSYGAESADFWLVKTDESGNIEWNHTYGGADFDRDFSLVKTSDEGYALAGYTLSFGAGEYDVWLVKTDASGNMEWNQTYGGAGNDYAFSLVETSDRGFAFAGSDRLVKTDGSGNIEWNKTYGEAVSNNIRSLVETSDGGYALAGYARTLGAENYDFWLVKTDGSGNMKWNKTYGGSRHDRAYSLIETSDGGYTLAGETRSYGAGNYDVWLVKTDGSGNLEWNRNYGGELNDRAYSLIEVSDGGYALAGETDSFGAGGSDFWLIKTNEQGVPEFPSWAPMLLTLLALTVILAVYRKKLAKTPNNQSYQEPNNTSLLKNSFFLKN